MSMPDTHNTPPTAPTPRPSKMPLLFRDMFRIWVPLAVAFAVTFLTGFAGLGMPSGGGIASDVRVISSLVSIVVYSLVYLALTWLFIARATPAQLRLWARREQGPSLLSRLFLSRVVGLLFVLTIGGYALVATLLIVRADERDTITVAIGATAVIVSWLTLHTSYTLDYAHHYYRHGGGGLIFPGGEEPFGLDFAYFAFTIATTFATADVSVTSRRVRFAVFGHGLFSFAYNTALLALVINVIFGR